MRINPAKMAALYYSMLRGRALSEVNCLIKDFSGSEETVSYWAQVKSLLEQCGKGKH